MHRAAIDKLEESKGQHSLNGLKAMFEPFLVELLKDKTTSVPTRWRGCGRGLSRAAAKYGREEREGLQKLLDNVCTLLLRLKPGFATSLVESFNSTYSRNWEKGQAYCLKSFEVRMVMAVLRWNRVPNWPKKVWDAAMPILLK
jgi:hypothetical protein